MVTAQNLKPVRQGVQWQQIRHPLRQKYPHRHNHYETTNFFTFDGDTGNIADWNRARNILVTEDFIVGLIEGLEDEVGAAAPLVVYKIGEQWGQLDARLFAGSTEQPGWFLREYQYEQGVSQLNLPYVLEAWWWPFTAQGWGNWEVDLSEQRNGFMFINIFDSVVARSLGNVGKPVCYLYAGMFAGFFTELGRQPLSCIELQCYATGESYCKFLLGKQERVDAAGFWQQQGATARDIEKRLKNGEGL